MKTIILSGGDLGGTELEVSETLLDGDIFDYEGYSFRLQGAQGICVGVVS